VFDWPVMHCLDVVAVQIEHVSREVVWMVRMLPSNPESRRPGSASLRIGWEGQENTGLARNPCRSPMKHMIKNDILEGSSAVHMIAGI